MKLSLINGKSPFILLILFSFTLNSCKKEEESEYLSNSFTYGGKTKELYVSTEYTKLVAQECLSNGTTPSKAAGMQLYFYNNDIILSLNLIGENKGKYSSLSTNCSEFKFKFSSSWKYRDPEKTGLIGHDSELEITNMSNNQISGNFKIRVQFDKDNINDSFIVGKFVNVPLRNEL